MSDSDQPRPDPTSPDSEYSLTIAETADRYAAAGHPRTPRAIQRYCANGHLDCRKVATTWGDKYLVAAYSVGRHISQIAEMLVASGRDSSALVVPPVPEQLSQSEDEPSATSGRDASRRLGASVVAQSSQADPRQDHTAEPDKPRPVAVAESAYVTRLEKENDFLHEQIGVKDTQIRDLTERARETNHLIAGLQKMLSPLLGSGERRDIGSRSSFERGGEDAAQEKRSSAFGG